MNKLFLTIIILLSLACNQKENNKQTTKNLTTDTTVFYPYTQYIQKEGYSILKNKTVLFGTITDNSGKKKMFVIDTTYFKNILAQFLSNDITKEPFKKYFQETVFRDLTTNSIVMTYSNKSDSSNIKNVDVYLDGTTNILKRIDIKTISAKADSSITENYTWTVGKELYLVRYAEANGKGNLSRTNIKWKLKN